MDQLNAFMLMINNYQEKIKLRELLSQQKLVQNY